MEGRRRLRARGRALRRVRAVEGRHPGVGDRAHDEAIDAALVGVSVFEVSLCVEVARGVVILEAEELEARTSHLEVEVARDREDRVAQRLCL